MGKIALYLVVVDEEDVVTGIGVFPPHLDLVEVVSPIWLVAVEEPVLVKDVEVVQLSILLGGVSVFGSLACAVVVNL